MVEHKRNHTLVLNKNWQAVTVTTSFGALISMCRERALAMCPESYQLFDIEAWIGRSIDQVKNKDMPIEYFVRTTSHAIERPEIIILKEYSGIPFKQVNLTRRNLYKRDGYICQYCTKAFMPDELTIDHVVPKSRGGQNTWVNCVTSCMECNNKKSNRTPQECGFKLLKEPKMPKWTPIAGMVPNIRPDSWDKFIKA